MAAALRVLDIPELQVLLNFPRDPNLHWHHRVLLKRVSDANWLVVTPDGEIEYIDLSEFTYRVLVRAAAFPADLVNDAYVFDPVDAPTMDGYRREARLQAQVLGADDKGGAEDVLWIYSDPNKPKFGEEVPAQLVEAAEGFAALGNQALVKDGDHVRACERVARGQLDQWKKDRQGEEIDIRVLAVELSAEGPSSLTLERAVGLMREDAMPHWTFEGPRVAKEFLKSVVESSGNLVSYHSEWIRLSGVQQSSAVGYEHRHCCEVLRLCCCHDMCDGSNLACIEQVVRRVIQLEMAVSKNPSAPDFVGLGVIGDGAVLSDGSSRVPKFRAWVADRQKERAQILKQNRLYTEEVRGRGRGKGQGERQEEAESL